MLYQKHGKTVFKKKVTNKDSLSLTDKNHPVIWKNGVISINNLSAQELNSTLITSIENKVAFQIYFAKIFLNKLIYHHEKLNATHIYDAFSAKY